MAINISSKDLSEYEKFLAKDLNEAQEILSGFNEDIAARINRSRPSALRLEAEEKHRKAIDKGVTPQKIAEELSRIEKKGLQDIYQKKGSLEPHIERLQEINSKKGRTPCLVIAKNTSKDELVKMRELIQESQKTAVSEKEKLFLDVILGKVQGRINAIDTGQPKVDVCIPLKWDEEGYAKKLNARISNDLPTEIQYRVSEVGGDKKLTEEEELWLEGLKEELYGIIEKHRVRVEVPGKEDKIFLKNEAGLQREMVAAVDSAFRAAKDIVITSGVKGWINGMLTKWGCEPYFKLDSESISEKFHSMKSALQLIKNDAVAPKKEHAEAEEHEARAESSAPKI